LIKGSHRLFEVLRRCSPFLGQFEAAIRCAPVNERSLEIKFTHIMANQQAPVPRDDRDEAARPSYWPEARREFAIQFNAVTLPQIQRPLTCMAGFGLRV